MERSQFAAVLPVIVGGLINTIIEKNCIDEKNAFNSLYNSELYEALNNEATKVWTYSVPKLYHLYQSETSTGKLELPDY